MSDSLNGTRMSTFRFEGPERGLWKYAGTRIYIHRSHDVIRVDETDAWHHIVKHDIYPSPFPSWIIYFVLRPS